MSIEAKSTHHSAKAVAGMEHRSGKKPTAGDASAGVAGGGFSALMNLMADAIPEEDLKMTDPLIAGESQSLEGNESLAHVGKALIATSNELNALPENLVLANFAGMSTVTPSPDGLPGTVPQAASVATSAPIASLAMAARSGLQTAQGVSTTPLTTKGSDSSEGGQRSRTEVRSMSTSAGATPATLAAQRQSPPVIQAAEVTLIPNEKAEIVDARGVDVLASHKRSPLSQSLAFGNALNDSRDVKAMPTTVQITAAQDAAQMVSMMTEAQGFMRPQERSGKPLSSQPGSGLEGAFGNALMDKLGINPTYEVAPTVAVVADTQVAETVSYWVTHGVQSAELTLDGFGNEPVEVRISLDGDQAQIDFWSNQADVRQVLENASAQLKEMLSSEGLQLTGMSVGTSGRERGQNEGHQPKSSTISQAKLLSVEPLAATVTRSANRAVGQSLDLYV